MKERVWVGFAAAVVLLAIILKIPAPQYTMFSFVSPFRSYFPILSRHAEARWRGVGATYEVDCAKLDELRIDRWYNWKARPIGDKLCPGKEFIPTIFNSRERDAELLHNSQIVIIGNEPEDPAQTNMHYRDLVKLTVYVLKRHPDMKVALGAAELPTATMWYSELPDWAKRRVGAVSFHFYSEAGSVEEALSHLSLVADLYRGLATRISKETGNRVELWCTEFAYVGGREQERVEFFTGALETLKAKTDLACPFQLEFTAKEWFWYWAVNTSLYMNGNLTALGRAYKEFE